MLNVLRISMMLVSLVIAGEAAALAVGMHFVKKSESAWVSPKNNLLLVLDLLVGLGLIVFTGLKSVAPLQLVLFQLF
jgi:hypothetical protein